MRCFALLSTTTLAILLTAVVGGAQSIEPEPRVVEVGGEVEVHAWRRGELPLTGLEIVLRGVDEEGRPTGGILQQAVTDAAGTARFLVDQPAGRYRFETRVGPVEVQTPFRVVPAAPRWAWAGFGVLVVAVAGLWARSRGRVTAGR